MKGFGAMKFLAFWNCFVMLGDFKEAIDNLRELSKNKETSTLVLAIDY